MGSKELEYPWTMTMDVMPTTTTENRTVLLGSSLSEICSEMPVKGILGYHKIGNKMHNIESNERHFGIGIERANCWSPVPIRPTHDRYRTLHAYDTHLPLNKWSKITMVGERKGVSLYIDGKLIGKSAKYLTCPLDTVGNRLGDSFVGRIKGLTVYNKVMDKGLGDL